MFEQWVCDLRWKYPSVVQLFIKIWCSSASPISWERVSRNSVFNLFWLVFPFAAKKIRHKALKSVPIQRLLRLIGKNQTSECSPSPGPTNHLHWNPASAAALPRCSLLLSLPGKTWNAENGETPSFQWILITFTIWIAIYLSYNHCFCGKSQILHAWETCREIKLAGEKMCFHAQLMPSYITEHGFPSLCLITG